MNTEYRQALEELEIARNNYNEVSNNFEGVAYKRLREAEDKVMEIIRRKNE